MITIKYRDLKFVSIFCLGLMSIVFFIGWLKAFIGIPLAIILFVAILLTRKNDDRTITIKKSYIVFIVFAVVIWALLSGIGGFFTQKNDNWARNVIFRDLINYAWPVKYDNGESLVYYFGHWLVPALFGKIGVAISGFEIGYLIGRIALLLWTSLIIILSILNVMFRVNSNSFKKLVIVLSVFILFSGMDAVMSLLHPITFTDHIEWWAFPFQFSSMTTQLCWVYNQAVVAWLATSLMLNEEDESNYALIGLLMLPSAPIPMVGLAFMLVLNAIVNFVKDIKAHKLKEFFKNVFSIQNIIAVVTLTPVYAIFYINNYAFMPSAGDVASSSGAVVEDRYAFDSFKYVFFILLEFLILLLLIQGKRNRRHCVISCIALMVVPLIRIGGEGDFCMRASIPALFVVMVMLIEYFIGFKDGLRAKSNNQEKIGPVLRIVCVSIIFIIGITTPMVEFGTSIRDYVKTNGQCVSEFDKYESLSGLSLSQKPNFVGVNSENALFYKTIGK